MLRRIRASALNPRYPLRVRACVRARGSTTKRIYFAVSRKHERAEQPVVGHRGVAVAGSRHSRTAWERETKIDCYFIRRIRMRVRIQAVPKVAPSLWKTPRQIYKTSFLKIGNNRTGLVRAAETGRETPFFDEFHESLNSSVVRNYIARSLGSRSLPPSLAISRHSRLVRGMTTT